MKKAAAMAAFIALCTISVSAANFGFGTKYPDAKEGIALSYDAEGKLCGAEYTKLENQQGTLTAPDLDSDNAQGVRLFLPENGEFISGFALPDSPEPTSAPTPGDSSFPKIYQREAYALSAPALVKKVSVGYEDGETVYNVKLLFWGEERDFTFKSNFLIKQASDKYSHLIDSNASVLKEGDVIILGYAFKDKPKDMCLLYRPTSDPVKTESSFLPLFTTGGLAGNLWSVNSDRDISYSFGIISKVSDRYFTLMQADGAQASAKDIPYVDDTFIYSYELSEKKSAAIGGMLFESVIPETDIDESGNVTAWSANAERCYALVRTIDGVATDVISFYE